MNEEELKIEIEKLCPQNDDIIHIKVKNININQLMDNFAGITHGKHFQVIISREDDMKIEKMSKASIRELHDLLGEHLDD